MFTLEPTSGTWQDEHQYLYSLLWSSFLDLDFYSASRFRRRYYPYSTEFVIRELLWDLDPRVQAWLPDAPRVSRTGAELSEPFRRLALWTVAPRLFEAVDPTQGGGRRLRTEDARKHVKEMRDVVTSQLRSDLQIELAAFRIEVDSRPLLPPDPALGIENTHLEIVAGRRSATALLAADVRVPYTQDSPSCGVVDPDQWSLFTYWIPQAAVRKSVGTQVLGMHLLLPGGNSASLTKQRALEMTYASTAGPFGARIDFDCIESAGQPNQDRQRAGALLEVQRARTPFPQQNELEQYTKPYDDDETHVDHLRGYLAIDKIAGRPGWTRFVSQREVRFESPNHDRFRVETLMFWLAIDLLSFTEKYASAKEPAR